MGSPKMSWTCKLRRVLNSAARFVMYTRNYDSGLHHAMWHDPHWLHDMSSQTAACSALVSSCIAVFTSDYLSKFCVHPSSLSSSIIPLFSLSLSLSLCLRHRNSNQLVVPPVKLSTYERSQSWCIWSNSLEQPARLTQKSNILLAYLSIISKLSCLHDINQGRSQREDLEARTPPLNLAPIILSYHAEDSVAGVPQSPRRTETCTLADISLRVHGLQQLFSGGLKV